MAIITLFAWLLSVLSLTNTNAGFTMTEDACTPDAFISNAADCEAAANALGITWNSCCQNDGNLPYGCLSREADSDVIWNGKADTQWTFPCDCNGNNYKNCAHGMRYAVCYDPTTTPSPEFQYVITEDPCISNAFISTAAECEDAARVLGIPWNDCCQNDGNLPYGCLTRGYGHSDMIWNGKQDTQWSFPCDCNGNNCQNCAHGMRYAVCYDTTASPTVDPTPEPTTATPTTVSPTAEPTFEFGYVRTEDPCIPNAFISSAAECEVAARALGITWNDCCQNDGNLPYGCLSRANDVIWNGKADTQWSFPCDCNGNNCQNCAHGMRWAICYDFTASPTPDPTPDPTASPTTTEPTTSPSVDPTVSPTTDPTTDPTVSPTTDLYLRVDEQLSRDDAEARCLAMYGTHLASIHSQFENDEAYELCAQNRPGPSDVLAGCWIGFFFDGQKQQIGWTDGSLVEFANWRDGAPNSDAHYNFIKVNADNDDSKWEDAASDSADSVSRFLCNAPAATTAEATTNGHYIASGNPLSGKFVSDVAFACQEDTNNQAAYESKNTVDGFYFGFNIGVACCSQDGSAGSRPSCVMPATYQEAVDKCESENLRLCTLQEVLSGKTKGAGCGFDNAYQWVSDECDATATDSGHGARSVERLQDPGFDVIESDEGDEQAVESTAAAWVASLTSIGVVAVVVLFYVLRRKSSNEKDVLNSSVEMSTSAPISV